MADVWCGPVIQAAAMSDHWTVYYALAAQDYDREGFTFNTAAEVEDLIRALRLRPDAAVLDIGCGTGRHAVELARRGMRVTGLDLSPQMLALARQRAEAAGVEVRWLEADATQFNLPAKFDAAYCVCEGAFGLLGSGSDPAEHDLSILKNVAGALRPGGHFLLTCLNGLNPIRRFNQEDVLAGRFDPATLSTTAQQEVAGQTVTLRYSQHTPGELLLLLRLAGLGATGPVRNGTVGHWGEAIDLDGVELFIVAKKPE